MYVSTYASTQTSIVCYPQTKYGDYKRSSQEMFLFGNVFMFCPNFDFWYVTNSLIFHLMYNFSFLIFTKMRFEVTNNRIKEINIFFF